MTISMVIGGELWMDFATNKGTGDFMRWVDKLDAVDFPLLVHLTDWGWVLDIKGLLLELEEAVERIVPDDQLMKTIKNAMTALGNTEEGMESVMLTDGTGSNETVGEWWIEGSPVK